MYSAIFKAFFLLVTLALTAPAFSQNAILPPAKTTFLDANGKPLTSGTVDFYIPSTTTRKATYQNAAGSVSNTNPVVLDAAGRALILGSGDYRQIVKDRNGNIIWDQVTSSTGTSGGGGSSVGDGNMVGTILPWAGIVAPPQYLFAAGQEISRTTYAQLKTAVTEQFTLTCASGSPILNGISDTQNIAAGAAVEASCIPVGSTVISKTINSVTLNQNAIVSTVVTATFYPYGNGNGVTTFNLPNWKGRAPIGRNNMNGAASSVMTSTYYGAEPNGVNALGGSQFHTMTTAELVAHTHVNTLTDPSHSHPQAGQTLYNTAGAGQGGAAGILANTNALSTAANTTGITINNVSAGSSTPFTIVQPSVTTNYIIKVTADISSSTFIGIQDIQGMTGPSISCGTGLSCSGNTINVIPGSLTGIIGITGSNGVVTAGQCATNLTGACVITYGGERISTISTSLAVADCGKTVQMGTGATGQLQVTLPAPGAGGMTGVVSPCEITVYNADTASGKGLVGFPAALTQNNLYPTQSLKVGLVNGVWALLKDPGRWRQNSTTLCDATFVCLYASNAGNNLNDCLSAATPCLNIGAAALKLYRDIDMNNGTPKIKIACGTYAESLDLEGSVLGTRVSYLSGATTAVHCVNWRNATGANNFALQIGDGAVWEVENIYFDCAGCAGTNFAIAMHQFSVIDVLEGNEFGEFGAGYNIYCDNAARINMPALLKISGSAGFFAYLADGCSLKYANPASAISMSVVPTYGVLFNLNGNSNATIGGLNWTTGASTTMAAGQKWSVTGNSYLDQTGVTWPTAGTTAGAPVASGTPWGGIVK